MSKTFLIFFRWVLILLDLYIVFVFVLDGLIYRTYSINGNENISVLMLVGAMFLIGLSYIVTEKYLIIKNGSERKLSLVAKIMLLVPASVLAVVFIGLAYLSLLFGFIGPIIACFAGFLMFIVVKYAISWYPGR